MDYSFPKLTMNPEAKEVVTTDVGKVLLDFEEFGVFMKDGHMLEVAESGCGYLSYYDIQCKKCQVCPNMQSLQMTSHYQKEPLIFELLKNGYVYIMNHMYFDSNNNRVI